MLRMAAHPRSRSQVKLEESKGPSSHDSRTERSEDCNACYGCCWLGWERESDYCGFGSIRAFKSTLPELFLVCIADEFALEGTSAPTTADTAAVSYDDRPPWHQRSTAVTSVTVTKTKV